MLRPGSRKQAREADTIKANVPLPAPELTLHVPPPVEATPLLLLSFLPSYVEEDAS